MTTRKCCNTEEPAEHNLSCPIWGASGSFVRTCKTCKQDVFTRISHCTCP